MYRTNFSLQSLCSKCSKTWLFLAVRSVIISFNIFVGRMLVSVQAGGCIPYLVDQVAENIIPLVVFRVSVFT